jgi:hypothetical protein
MREPLDKDEGRKDWFWLPIASANIWDVFGGLDKWIVCGFGVKRTNVCVCGNSRVVGGSYMRF